MENNIFPVNLVKKESGATHHELAALGEYPVIKHFKVKLASFSTFVFLRMIGQDTREYVEVSYD